MSKQGKNNKKNNLSSELKRQNMPSSIYPAESLSVNKTNTMRRNIMVVLTIMIVGVLLTFVFEDKKSEDLQTNAQDVSKPVADVVSQQGNKLTTVIAAAKKPSYEAPTMSEINEPDISELVSNEIDANEIIIDELAANEAVEDGIEAKQEPVEQAQSTELSEPEEEAVPSEQPSRWVSHVIAPGETLAKIFRGKKLPLVDLYAITAIEGDDKPLSRILPNQQLRFKLNDAETLDTLEIQGGATNIVFVRTSQGKFIRKQ